MNVALIIAGGSGSRMGANVPKQFLEVYGKPILIYTLERFQRHPMIDMIEVVCLSGWEDKLRDYADFYGITKLRLIVTGGETGQESIRNGISGLSDTCAENDVIVVHDGIRPIVEDEILTDVISKCSAKGNAVTSIPYYEQVFIKKEDETTDRYIPRDNLRVVATPQAYLYGKLRWAYDEGFSQNKGIGASTYANTLMVELGETLNLAAGSRKNIKLTTLEDIEIFKALLKVGGEQNGDK